MTINEEKFKRALAQWATGVTVVTSLYKGMPVGVTVTAFSSLSLEPPLVTICLDKSLFTHQVVLDNKAFAVNVLSEQQQEMGLRFAGMLPDVEERFEGLVVTTAVTGCPLLADCLMTADCRLWRVYDGGDHSLFVGEVVAVQIDEKKRPLLYFNREWLRGVALL